MSKQTNNAAKVTNTVPAKRPGAFRTVLPVKPKATAEVPAAAKSKYPSLDRITFDVYEGLDAKRVAGVYVDLLVGGKLVGQSKATYKSKEEAAECLDAFKANYASLSDAQRAGVFKIHDADRRNRKANAATKADDNAPPALRGKSRKSSAGVRQQWRGNGVCAMIRWMGKDGFNAADVLAAAKADGITTTESNVKQEICNGVAGRYTIATPSADTIKAVRVFKGAHPDAVKAPAAEKSAKAKAADVVPIAKAMGKNKAKKVRKLAKSKK